MARLEIEGQDDSFYSIDDDGDYVSLIGEPSDDDSNRYSLWILDPDSDDWFGCDLDEREVTQLVSSMQAFLNRNTLET